MDHAAKTLLNGTFRDCKLKCIGSSYFEHNFPVVNLMQTHTKGKPLMTKATIATRRVIIL